MNLTVYYKLLEVEKFCGLIIWPQKTTMCNCKCFPVYYSSGLYTTVCLEQFAIQYYNFIICPNKLIVKLIKL